MTTNGIAERAGVSVGSVPDTWVDNGVILLRPEGAPITIEGTPMPDAEFESVGLQPREHSLFDRAKVPRQTSGVRESG